MVNCLCENSPRFHQIMSNKKSKIKISQGSIPPDPPSLLHALHTDTYLPPIIYTISLCPLPPSPWGKSWKKPWKSCVNHDVIHRAILALIECHLEYTITWPRSLYTPVWILTAIFSLWCFTLNSCCLHSHILTAVREKRGRGRREGEEMERRGEGEEGREWKREEREEREKNEERKEREEREKGKEKDEEGEKKKRKERMWSTRISAWC